MDTELAAEIRNKLTAPLIALEKVKCGEKVPQHFVELSIKELERIVELLKDS